VILPDGDEERRALDAFRREIEAYCARAHGHAAAAGVLSISVATAWEPSASFRRRVHQSAYQTVEALLPRVRVGLIDLRSAGGLPGPGWVFAFTPPAVPAAFTPPAVPAPAATLVEPAPPPPARPLRLVLRYAGNQPWRYPVPAGEVWAPVGRWPDEEGDRWGLRFPSYAGFVPRGKLLYVRQHGDGVLLARSRARPDYVVRLNGAVLLPGDGPVEAGPAGSIEYAKAAPPSTTITYEVVPEAADDRS
jgi:hypothetical protein